MRIFTWLAGIAVTALLCAPALSATVAGVGVRDSLLTDTLENWSVGINGEIIERGIKHDDDGHVSTLEAESVSLFFGYDTEIWLTLFATFGADRTKNIDSGADGDTNFKWSAGLLANLWKTKIIDPNFLAGNITLRGILEAAQYELDEKDAGISGEWTDLTAALTVNYEMFADKEETVNAVPFSLLLYVGAVASSIDGNAKVNGSPNGFKEDKLVGFIGGMDLYISHNLSLGGQVEYFDEPTYGINLIYHF